jgi:hypothetical protein
VSEDWLDRMLHVRKWAQGGTRAPHKPMLMLLALARLQATGSSRLAYVEAEAVLDDLLDEYGPSTWRTTTAYPFHRLQNDGLWTVRTTAGPSPGDSPVQLRRLEATGQFVPDLEAALKADPRLLVLAARALLDANFPESLHAELSDALGLDLEGAEVALAKGRVASRRCAGAIHGSGRPCSWPTSTGARCAASTDGSGVMPSPSTPRTCGGGRSRARTTSTTPCASARSTTSCSTGASWGSRRRRVASPLTARGAGAP